MDKQAKNFFPKWNKNDLIRHKTNGHPYLVQHVYKNQCTMAIDLESSISPTPILCILPRDYSNYALDSDLDLINEEKWSFNPFENYMNRNIFVPSL